MLSSGDDDEEEEEGGDEGEEGEEKMPTCGDYIMHFLTLFWKVIFATIPPAGKQQYLFSFNLMFFLEAKISIGSHVKNLKTVLRRHVSSARKIYL